VLVQVRKHLVHASRLHQHVATAPARIAREVVARHRGWVRDVGGQRVAHAVREARRRGPQACDGGVDEGDVVDGCAGVPPRLAEDLRVHVALREVHAGRGRGLAEVGERGGGDGRGVVGEAHLRRGGGRAGRVGDAGRRGDGAGAADELVRRVHGLELLQPRLNA
jgi:hypothetical protein